MSVLQGIKNCLKRILPLPATSMLREMDVQNRRIDQLTAKVDSLNRTVNDLKKIIYKTNKPVYWRNETEYRVVNSNWGRITEQPDFKDKYLRLISGLDADSITIITRIIARQKKYLESGCIELDFFTREEQEKIRLLDENFTREIFKVSDTLYAYRNYLLPINHFESSVFYYRHGIDELKTIKNVRGRTVLDVGGFIGDSILVFSELQPKTIYSFEPDPDNYAIMQETLSINHITNAVPVNMALGNHSGTCILHKGGSVSGTVFREGVKYKEDVEVPMTTLDAFVEEHPLEIGLIKIDIEGGEPWFLEGAKKTISEQRPILLVSIYHNAHDFFELKPMIESWNLGYRFSIHKPTFGNATSETLLLCEVYDVE